MTIQYYIGGKIVGLQADTKPLLVPENSTFIESDTFKEFIFVSGVWEQVGTFPPTFEDDFADGSNWTASGASPTVTGGVMSCIANDSARKTVTWHDLGSPVSDTTWTLRASCNVTLVNPNSDGTAQEIFLALSSTNGLANSSPQDSITFKLRTNSSTNEVYQLNKTDNGTMSGNSENSLVHLLQVEQVFMDLRRISATEAKLTLYSDSDYSSPVAGGSVTDSAIPAGIINLQFIKFCIHENDTTPTGDITALFDDLKFWNGLLV